MFNIKKASMMAAACAMLAPAAFAGDYHDVVKDLRGNVVVSTNGNCVETQWDSKFNQCGKARITSRLTKEERTVYFDFNKSTLNAKEKKKLDDVSRIIIESKEVENVDIIGYADEIGKSSYNKKLSERRAATVKSYLATKGLKTKRVVVQGRGEAGSVTSCDEKLPRAELISCLAADRRVEIQLNVKQ